MTKERRCSSSMPNSVSQLDTSSTVHCATMAGREEAGVAVVMGIWNEINELRKTNERITVWFRPKRNSFRPQVICTRPWMCICRFEHDSKQNDKNNSNRANAIGSNIRTVRRPGKMTKPTETLVVEHARLTQSLDDLFMHTRHAHSSPALVASRLPAARRRHSCAYGTQNEARSHSREQYAQRAQPAQSQRDSFEHFPPVA